MLYLNFSFCIANIDNISVQVAEAKTVYENLQKKVFLMSIVGTYSRGRISGKPRWRKLQRRRS
jgi:hypothetical protein